MTEPPLPNWFQVFGDGLRRELQEIKDAIARLDSKADAIHSETQRTNGRVTSTEGRVKVLERARDDATTERRHKGQVWGGPIVGGVFTLILVTVVELLKHVH